MNRTATSNPGRTSTPRLTLCLALNIVGTSTSTLALPFTAYHVLGGTSGAVLFTAASLVGRALGALGASRLRAPKPVILFAVCSFSLAVLLVAYFAIIASQTQIHSAIYTAIFVAYGILAAILSVAQFRLIGQIVTPDGMSQFYAKLGMLVQVASVGGAAIVALLGAASLLRWALIFDALTFIVAGGILLSSFANAGTATTQQSDLTERSRYPALLILVAIAAVPAVGVSIVNTSLAEIVDTAAAGRQEYLGIIDLIYASGAFVGAWALNRFTHGRTRLVTGVAAAGTAGLALAVAVGSGNLSAVVITMFLLASSLSVVNVWAFAELQLRSRPDQKGAIASLTLLTNVAFFTVVVAVTWANPSASASVHFAMFALFAGALAACFRVSDQRLARR